LTTVGLDNIRKRFGAVEVLKGVSLDITPGEFVTLVGPSGCGKSTLLRIIAGLERQDDGSVSIGGRSVDALRPKARDVAMVFQSYALYPYMTVRQNLALPLVMRRLDRWQRLPLIGRFLPGTSATRAAIDGEIAQVSAALEIAHLLDRKPAQLSGGQRQRVALGRAMVRRPQVFLMDEPLSNLDAKLRVQMRAEIAELHRRLGATFIYVTHDQAEAMTMSDRVAVMLTGELIQVAPPRQLYAEPEDLRVAEFIGSPKINVLPAIARGDGVLDCIGLTLPGPRDGAGARLSLGVRPEALSPAPAGSRECWHGTLAHLEHLGAETLLHIAVDGAGRVLVRVDPDRAAPFAIGAPIALRPDTAKLLWFDGEGRRVRSGPRLREVAHG
jgi:multiple sugar transport system ATP-binding protein